MYKDFFNLKDLPFTLSPDPQYIVFTPSYNEVLASLYYGLESAKGLMVLTGEVGTGKTTALRWILRRMDTSVLAAYIINPRLSTDEFYYQVSELLGITDWENKAELLSEMSKVLAERHRRGLRTVLIIDEAQELSDHVLEEIRLLMNFESDSAKHLQIILTGQPELRDKLNQKNLRQLKQRVALRCQVDIFPNASEVGHYITHRLLVAGSERTDIFTNEAIDLIFQCSEGIPRQINNLCDNAMLTAYAMGEETVSRQIIEQVADNLDLLPQNKAFISNIENLGEIPPINILTSQGERELWSNRNGEDKKAKSTESNSTATDVKVNNRHRKSRTRKKRSATRADVKDLADSIENFTSFSREKEEI